MKCPGCNFVCSELRDLCPKCISDLRPYKISAGLPVTNSNASYDELVAKAQGKRWPSPTPAQGQKALLGSVISAIANVIKHRSAHEDRAAVLESPAQAATPTLEETNLLITEHYFPMVAGAAGPTTQLFEWVVPAPERESESNLQFTDDAPSQGQIDAIPPSTSTEIDSAESDSIGREATFTEAAQPVDEPQLDNTTELHTLSTEIELEPPTTSSVIYNPSRARIPNLPEAPEELSTVLAIHSDEPTPQNAAPEAIQINLGSEEIVEFPRTARPSPEDPTLRPLDWNGDVDSVEEAFGDAFSDIRSLIASATIHTEHLFQHSLIDSEQIQLEFSLALDELEGRLEPPQNSPISTSEGRSVEASVLNNALEEVETQIDRADQTAPLKEFIKESLADHAAHQSAAARKDSVAIPPRLFAVTIDVLLTFFVCLIITSVLERGGLTELMADLSVNGLGARHHFWLFASATLVPVTLIAYHFVTLPFFQATLGERIMGLSIRGRNGRPIKFKHILLRALTAPLSTVVGGPLYLLLAKTPPQDYFSSTEMHHIGFDT